MIRPYINKKDRAESWAKYRNYAESIHHIIATSIWWANVEQNKIALLDNFHIAHHRIYWNLPPDEQLKQRIRVNWKALNDKFIKDLEWIIDMDDKYIYKEGIRIKNKCLL